MKITIKKFSFERLAQNVRRFDAVHAFTLVELLVFIATLAVLSVILLPALAGSRAQSGVAACAANFRQWAVSVNLYANDHLDWLPRFDWQGGGGNYLYDVSTNMVVALAPYGLTIPMWFDPARPGELDNTERSFENKYGRPMRSIEDLQAIFNNNPYGEAIIPHNWWVQRSQSIPAFAGTIYPPDATTDPVFLSLYKWIKGTPVGMYGFPKRVHDNAAAHVPFVSCKAGSSLSGNGFDLPLTGKASRDPNDCSPNTAHFVNGVLLGVNAAYADGHVESHNKNQMNCGYDQGEVIFWFY